LKKLDKSDSTAVIIFAGCIDAPVSIAKKLLKQCIVDELLEELAPSIISSLLFRDKDNKVLFKYFVDQLKTSTLHKKVKTTKKEFVKKVFDKIKHSDSDQNNGLLKDVFGNEYGNTKKSKGDVEPVNLLETNDLKESEEVKTMGDKDDVIIDV
jgi:hypothetical protein